MGFWEGELLRWDHLTHFPGALLPLELACIIAGDVWDGIRITTPLTTGTKVILSCRSGWEGSARGLHWQWLWASWSAEYEHGDVKYKDGGEE